MKTPTLRMAWRNLWRNKRRTLITGGAVGLGLGVMVFSVCWAEGLNRHMINTVTRSWLGHAQIHATGYRATREPELTMEHANEALALAENTEGVASAAPRLYGEALLAIGDRSEPVIALGFDPLREAGVTDAAIYRHYRSKKELWQSAYASIIEEMVRDKRDLADSDAPLCDKLREWVRL